MKVWYIFSNFHPKGPTENDLALFQIKVYLFGILLPVS